MRPDCSLLRHPGLTQAGEEGGFVQSTNLGHPPISVGLHVVDAGKKISAVQSPGFGEFHGGALGLASECISRGKPYAVERYGRHGAAPLFEPYDRLVGARLQQMYSPKQEVPPADMGIAG